jgi:hypothetical protein
MAGSFEEENLEILQNIEWSILNVYRAHTDLTDYQVDQALEALTRSFQREKAGDAEGAAALLPKNDLPREVYLAMKLTCNWRMGREEAVVDETDQPIQFDPVDIDTILACLKRLRKSLSTWNKRSGTRGYLDYIAQFLA